MSNKIKAPLGIGLNDCLIVLGFIFLAIRGYLSFLSDPGTGWHLRLGKMIANHHQLPRVDPKIFSSEHSFWILDQWLGDLILYFLSGYHLAVLYVAFGCLFVWLVYRLLYSNLRKLNCSLIFTSIVCLYVNIFLGIHFLARPVFLSFILFVYFYFFLFSWRIEKDSLLKNLAILFLLSTLWANIHSSFLLIWPLICIKLFVDLYLTTSKLNLLGKYAYIGLTALLATLLTPDHFQLYFHQVGLTIEELINPSYTEWAPFEFTRLTGALFFFPVVVSLVVFLSKPKEFTGKYYFLITGLVFTVLGYSSTRFLVYYAISIAPVFLLSLQLLGNQVAKLLDRSNFGSYMLARFQNIELMEAGSTLGKNTFLMIAFIMLSYSVSTGKVLLYSNLTPQGLTPKSEFYPPKAISYLNNLPKDQNVRVFNTPNSGGFLNGYTSENIKYFIDDRTSYHGRGRYQYVSHWLKPDTFQAVVNAHSIDYLLVERTELYEEFNMHLLKNFSDQLVLSNANYIMMKTSR